MGITASVGGESAGVFTWVIEYDDQTRNVTSHAEGQGRCLVTVKITSAITRTIAYVQPGAAGPQGADFVVTIGNPTSTLASSVAPAQVSRIVGKPGALGGLEVLNEEWSRATGW